MLDSWRRGKDLGRPQRRPLDLWKILGCSQSLIDISHARARARVFSYKYHPRFPRVSFTFFGFGHRSRRPPKKTRDAIYKQ